MFRRLIPIVRKAFVARRPPWPALAAAAALVAMPPAAAVEPSRSLVETVEYQVEPAGEPLAVDDLLHTSLLLDWEPLAGPINFGFTHEAIWYRVELEHDRPQALTRYLEVENALLRDLQAFHVVGGEVIASFSTGSRLPFRERPIDHRHFVFPLELRTGQANQVLLRIQTAGSHRAPLILWKPEAFASVSRREMLTLGALYGTMVTMAVFNLLLFFGLRQRMYLYLGGAVASLVLVLTLSHGTAYQFVFPGWPALEGRLVAISVPLMSLLFLGFGGQFMGLQKQASKVRTGLRAVSAATAIALVSALFLSYGLATRLAAVMLALVCLFLLAVAVIESLRGNRNARFFLVTWCILLLGGLSKVLVFAGWLNHPLAANYAMEIGAVAVSLLFSLALSEQFHHERRNRLAAIAEREESERRLLEATRRHSVSDLPNRGVLEHRLGEIIGGDTPPEEKLALVLLHLRDFDDINRTLGHHNADRMLRHLALRLDQAARAIPEHVPLDGHGEAAHALAHIEGVTFGCAFRVSERDRMTAIMQRLAECTGQPIQIESLELTLSAVYGCAFYPDDSPDVATLLRHAFIAYGSADADVNHIAVYANEDIAYSARRLTLMTELKQALEADRLSLVFQPQARGIGGEPFGFEALLRWPHDLHGFVAPDEFIPMAERSGLMPALTEWVVDRALAFQRRLEDDGALTSISVNISPINLRDEYFADMVRRALKRRGVAPQRLVLEVTETAAMLYPQHTLATLRALNDMNIQVSIDDFGTGHSSLAYLRRLPVQELKIDRSFVMEMDRNQDDLTIVRTIVNMCHDLGYRVVAEGVESRSALELLAELECDVVQGYFLARPMAEAGALEWIAGRRGENA